jgi:hypothetical protein
MLVDVLLRTFTSKEGSMIAAKLRGRWDDSSLGKDADGHFFIDQPIELFQSMVEYLCAHKPAWRHNSSPGKLS